MSNSENHRRIVKAIRVPHDDPSAPKIIYKDTSTSKHSNVKLVQAVSGDLFSNAYPGPQFIEHSCDAKYVSDIFTEDFLAGNFFQQWGTQVNQIRLPILISAQTGKGKNFFITNTLREFAKKRKQRILYVCNRVALNFQQKQELAKMTNSSFYTNNWETQEEFDNVTVITYQKLGQILSAGSTEFCNQFTYVVLDEAHFFYSDAFFNAHTGSILKQIPISFAHCFRIYMTATPDNVISPIYSAELGAIDSVLPEGVYYIPDENKFENLNRLPPMLVYTFKRDFSAYQDVYFFSTTGKKNADLQRIYEEILSAKNLKMREKEKWIIFISNKKAGRKLKKKLDEKGIHTLYVDRESANSEDDWEQIGWKKISRNGNLDGYDVLITTAVLDNGFSIKDKDVKNIVLLTDDKTEFLQELGRVRLFPDQKVHIYVSRTTKLLELNPGINTQRRNTFEVYYGQNAVTDKNKSLMVMSSLWHTDSDERRSFINPVGINNQYISLVANPMAYYRTLQISKEIDAYNMLVSENEKYAPILYKLKWLADNPDEITVENMRYTDADIPAQKRIIIEFEEFLQQYSKLKMEAARDIIPEVGAKRNFINFQNELKEWYNKLLGEKNQQELWQENAINNHLAKLEKTYPQEFEHHYDFKRLDKSEYYTITYYETQNTK